MKIFLFWFPRVDRNKYQIHIPLPPKIDPTVTMMQVEEKPDVTYSDVGGCKEQIEKLREVVETPLLHVSYYHMFLKILEENKIISPTECHQISPMLHMKIVSLPKYSTSTFISFYPNPAVRFTKHTLYTILARKVRETRH